MIDPNILLNCWRLVHLSALMLVMVWREKPPIVRALIGYGLLMIWLGGEILIHAI